MKIITAVALAFLLLAGCAKKNQTTEAVRQGVISDISKSFKMDSMDVTVDSVSFRDKEADATVTYTLKGGQRGQGMSMKYVMEQRDDGQWHIKSRSSMADSGAGSAGSNGAGAMPAGHPNMGGADASTGGGALPPGHPALGQSQ